MEAADQWSAGTVKIVSLLPLVAVIPNPCLVSGVGLTSFRSGIMDDCSWDFKAEGNGKDRKSASQVKKEHLQTVHMCAHKITLPSPFAISFQVFPLSTEA